MKNSYNSAIDTLAHKENIENIGLLLILPILYKRIMIHDDSKLSDPEKPVYDKYIPILRPLKYGTPEYEQARREMENDGLRHHYEANAHHPEHFENGINDMDMCDFVEMICDWFAASLRSDATFIEGLDRNCNKYNIPPMIKNIITNTYEHYFKDFESFIKNKELNNIAEEFYNNYKKIITEVTNNGLYNPRLQDYLENNLLDIMAMKEDPKDE